VSFQPLTPRGAAFLRVLLNKYHKGSPDALLRRLPQQEEALVQATHTATADVRAAGLDPAQELASIHFSWLQPFVESFSDAIRPVVIASLTDHQAAGLRSLLRIGDQRQPPSTLYRKYLLTELYRRFRDPGVMPFGLLPETPMHFLAHYTKRQLTQLVDFLGLYDLADEIRRTVDTSHLKTVFGALNPAQREFLRSCLHIKSRLASPKLRLEKWRGNPAQLMVLLHRRGLARLGKALCGQSPDFMWHLTHILDTGRGDILKQYWTNQEIAGITPVLQTQMQAAANFLQLKRSDVSE